MKLAHSPTGVSALLLIGFLGLLLLMSLAPSGLGQPTYGLPPMAGSMLSPELPRAEALAIAQDCLQANANDRTALMLCVAYRSESWRLRYGRP